MTAHVFVVSAQTFDLHLKYLFVGTGSGEYQIDFNNNKESSLHHRTEESLAHLIADGSRLRSGDSVFFYVQQSSSSEGRFYGIFECIQDGCFLDNEDKKQFLRAELGKNLNIRARIRPKVVYQKGISEWDLLDDISSTKKPYEMMWSLIYRKLKGNRGNTMITLFEEQLLKEKLEKANLGMTRITNNSALQFSLELNQIDASSRAFKYKGESTPVNLLPRLNQKYVNGQAFEALLQGYIVKCISNSQNPTLNQSLFENHILEWLGNEVSCGVGMQKIDILAQTTCDNATYISPIELKAVTAQQSNLKQLQRYINWLQLYYIPTMPGTIRPVLITKAFEVKDSALEKEFTKAIKAFNAMNTSCVPLNWLTYSFNNSELEFKRK